MGCGMCSIRSGMRVSCKVAVRSVPNNETEFDMKRTLLLALFTFSVAFFTSCDRDKGKVKPQDGGGGATTRSSDSAAAIPKIGLSYFTKETYKPLVGRYGGRIVRDTIGEPKSFN